MSAKIENNHPWSFEPPLPQAPKRTIQIGILIASVSMPLSCTPPSGTLRNSTSTQSSSQGSPAPNPNGANPRSPSTPAIQAQRGSAVISGSVTLSPLCTAGSTQLILTSGQQTVYQTFISTLSTYELHVTPGRYTLFAQSENRGDAGGGAPVQAGGSRPPSRAVNCSTQVPIVVEANQALQVNLVLNPGNTALASNSTPTVESTTQTVAQPQAEQPGSGPISAYPCPWYGYGCLPNLYPGSGGAVAGKPNIYLSAPEGTQVRLQVRTVGDSNLLAAVPVHGTSGWDLRVRNSELELGAGRVGFLFYDYRFNHQILQARQGFCLPPGQALQAMIEILEANGFKPQECADFRASWKDRLPRALKLCVYPQREEEIARVSELVINPPADELTRIWFLIVPSSPLHYAKAGGPIPQQGVDFPKGALAFRRSIDTPFALADYRLPSRKTSLSASASSSLLAKAPPPEGRQRPGGRSPASTPEQQAPESANSASAVQRSSSASRLQIREWGVSFLIHERHEQENAQP